MAHAPRRDVTQKQRGTMKVFNPIRLQAQVAIYYSKRDISHYTVLCHYNPVNILQIPHDRRPKENLEIWGAACEFKSEENRGIFSHSSSLPIP